MMFIILTECMMTGATDTVIMFTQVLFSLPDFRAAKQALRHAYKLNTPIESDRKTIAKNLKLGKNICMLITVRIAKKGDLYLQN
jgi:hypothetical protein